MPARVLPAAVFCALALAGCGGDREQEASSATAGCIVGQNIREGVDPPPTPEELRAACDGVADRLQAPLPAGATPQQRAGWQIATDAGCLACHRIGTTGNDGPGPDLTAVGARLPDEAIRRALVDPAPPMPSFQDLPPDRLDALVAYLGGLD